MYDGPNQYLLIPLRAVALLSLPKFVGMVGLYKGVARVCQELRFSGEKIDGVVYLPGFAFQTSFQSRIEDFVTSLPKADFDQISACWVLIFVINVR